MHFPSKCVLVALFLTEKVIADNGMIDEVIPFDDKRIILQPEYDWYVINTCNGEESLTHSEIDSGPHGWTTCRIQRARARAYGQRSRMETIQSPSVSRGIQI
jgi:hypothetical protein